MLVLLYPMTPGGELHLVLTRRSDSVADHKGQISFPGGSVDPDDSSTAHTALREACEEIGVCNDDLRLLGDLTPLYIPPSDFRIYPHVSYLPQRPVFSPQPDEVAELIEVPIRHFLDANTVVWEDWTLRGQPVRVPFYDVNGHKVWGATAMVLAEFAAVLEAMEGGGGRESGECGGHEPRACTIDTVTEYLRRWPCRVSISTSLKSAR